MIALAGAAGFGVVVGFLVAGKAPARARGPMRDRLPFLAWAVAFVAGGLLVSWSIVGDGWPAIGGGVALGALLERAWFGHPRAAVFEPPKSR
jgi:hypothetical protein